MPSQLDKSTIAADARSATGAPAVLRWSPVDGEGRPASVGAVTVDVAHVNGAAVATGLATTGTGDAERTATLPAAYTGTVARMVATWKTGADVLASTTLELVAGFMFSLAELRQFPGLRAVDGKFTDEQALAMRAVVEADICHATEMAWRRSYRRIVTTSAGGHVFMPLMVQRIMSISLDDVALTAADWTVDASARLVDAYGCPPRVSRPNGLVVEVEWGYDAPTPALKRAAIQACRFRLFGDAGGVSPRATSHTNDLGSTVFARTSKDRPFGIDELDSVVAAHAVREPGIA